MTPGRTMSAVHQLPQHRIGWGAWHDAELRALVERGLAVKVIAQKMGRAPRAVDARMAKLGLSVTAARKRLWQQELIRRSQAADPLSPIAEAVLLLVAAGRMTAWVHPDHIRVDGVVYPVAQGPALLAGQQGAPDG